ncbi:MAG: M3 family metallopeptidase [Brevirhabdus sp.]
MTNPLLAEWTSTFKTPPFSQLSDEDFAPAMDIALANARAEMAAIANHPEPPSFENTIEALERMGDDLQKVASTFFTLAGVDLNEVRRDLQREFAPKLAAYSSELMMNKAIFQRVETLWRMRDTLELSAEQHRVLMLRRRAFVRAGAQLSGKPAERLKEITARLAVLGTEFTQNLLADERDWSMELTADDLDGLPDFVVLGARAAADERGKKGYVVTLSRSLITPFLQYSTRRDLRQTAYLAYTSRGANGGDTDNRAIAAETLALREERANLLGYDTFAAFKLETEMARTPKAVEELLMQVWAPARAKAVADAEVLEAMMHDDGINGRLEPWDWHFYEEKRRAKELNLDESRIKPYLQLDEMIAAAFDVAHRLFGLVFQPVEVDLYHPDVFAWDVTRDGKHMAVFIGDYFARPNKRSGAWCSAWRSQQKLKGDIRPLVHNVCNFAKPEPGAPSLLSLDDARTLFHEFGHALHQILSDVTYSSISGTSVARDFVELPSQLFEHWLEVPEILQKHARHAKNGKPIPQEMLDRVLSASTFGQGFATVEYVASALVDLAFHNGPAPADPMAKQAEVLNDIGMPHAIAMRHATPHFAHVFAGDGYSSGYYSYMWSEVMDADAFAAFEEAGDPFDRDLAGKLEHFILSAGGSEEGADLYTKFRGRMPGVEALLKGRGLLDMA